MLEGQGHQTLNEPVEPNEPIEPTGEPTEPKEPDTPSEPTEPKDPTEPEEPFLTIKYNKEEVPLDKDKAVELAQKGMNYDKIYERLQQLENDPRLSFVENQAKKHGMTVEQYLEAVKQAEEQQRLNELIEQNIPEELAQEILENRKFREQYEQERKAKEKQEKEDAERLEFLEYFKQENGRYFDEEKDSIPESVFKEWKSGKRSLVDAYIRYQNQQLKEQLTKLQEGKEKQAKNEENANATTGPVKGGDGKQPYFTKEQVEKMSTEEINKNWKAIMESQKHWFK